MKKVDETSEKLLLSARQSSLDHLMAQRGMRQLASKLNDALRPLDISAAQFCLLSLLYRDDAPNASELAQEMQSETAHVSSQLSILTRRALIASAPRRADCRGRRIMLTPHGTSILAQAIPLWLKANEEAARSISTAQLRQLRLLTSMPSGLDDASRCANVHRATDGAADRPEAEASTSP
ncbi:DNA-binding MarR family transcriptional regulator [Paraburkholderia sp. GAS348]|jgi:DNA-binding MarR family transcriptional regulator